MSEYKNMRHCAFEGCTADAITGYAWLERISPTGPGKPFVGLCQDHYGMAPIRLKPEAQALMP